uniref:Helicase domino n=1 Tax=Rhabditophanes sp. KR3021 TaxID=114890 RepID=A0AC35UD17_9BILA
MREPAHPHPGHSNTQMLPKISTRIQRKTQGMEQNVFGQTLPDLSIKKNYKALFGPKQTPQKVFNCVVKAIVEHIIREKKDTIKKNRSAFNRRKNITTLHFAKDTHTCVRSTFYNDNDINLLDILSKETTTRKVQAKIIKKLPRKKKTVQVRRTIAKIKPITRLRKKAGETFAVPGTSAIPKFLPSNAFEPEKMDTTTTPSPKKTTIHTPTTPSPKKIPIDTSTKGTIPDNSTVKEPMDTTANTTPSGNTPNKISTPKQVTTPRQITTPNQITTPPALPKTPTKTVEKAGSGVTLDDVPISVKKNITILIPEKAMLPTPQNALPETEDAATLLAKKIISTTEANVNMQPMLDTETSGSVIAKKQFEAAEKIKFLKKEGLWSQDQLPICNEPYRGKAHQDFMLEEMTWMYKDFTLERKRKQGMAALICKELRKLFKQRDALEERKLNSEVQEAIKHHAKVAKLIRTFWQEAYQVVQHKESCILDLARRRAREERLRQTVAKANTMTQMVCESMNTDGLLEDYETESEDEEKASRSVLEEADSEIAALQKEENEDISELMRKYYPGFVENMANESRVEESEDDEPPPVKRPRRATAKESTKETAKEVVAPSPAQTPSKNNNKVQEAIENNGEKLSELSEELKTLQPKGFTLDSSEIIVKQPTFIKGTLREYQLLGLNWLVTLYNRKLNAILADEMGLGKTLQTIALLAHMALEEKNWGPHLIVVPTSVILNWEMEFKKWCPEFKILTYFGNAKERQEKRKGWTKENAFNVVITSYKIATNDIKSFRKRQWQYYILDEAHTIKNSKSQRWQQLLNVKAMRRLLLTGTPLQNNLMELWSLMHFLMPSMFGSQEDFQNVFNDPLQDMASMNSDQNKDLITKLHDVLRPFLLRRLKKDVEKQLPTKREEVVYCNLSTRQRYLYEDFMDRRETQQNLASGSVFSVLNIVMQLRKCCNHPNLFEKRQTESPFVCYDIKKFYPGVIMDLVEKNKMVTGVSESLIFNNGAMNSSAVKESLRQLKMTKQQFKENEEGRQLKNLPKVSGFKFHNPIQTHFESIQFVRQNMVEGQKVLTAEINVNNMAKLNLSYSDEFILSFDDTYVDRLPFFVTDKKPILVRIDIDPHTQMPAIFLVNKDDIIMPTKLRQFQFARNYQNNFVLIKRHDPANLNLKKFIKPPTNILTTTSRTAINPTKLHQNLRTNVQTSRVTKNFIPAPYLPVSKSKGGREEENYVGSDSVLPVLEIEEDELMDTSIYQAIEAEVGANEQFLSNLSVSRIDRLQNSYVSSELLRFINRSANSSTYIQKDGQFVVSYNHCNTELNSEVIIFDPVQKFVDYNMDYFGIYTYPAISNRCIVETIGRGRLPDVVQALNDVQIEATDKFSELSETFHQVRLSKMFSFPELRLIEYDCGKLQKMAELLRNLYLNKHRVLIFTQMSKMLDILQVFLSYHGYQYFRLDGTTGIEQRQCMTERFNTDPKIFCFILSTRSGGVGINLTGADTVIFYDTDWNPTMDAQAEDRCHRIGQTKNVTVYRLISHHTIEENIYQKAQVKKRLGQIAIDNAGFTPDFFKDTSNIRDLFKDNKGKIDINPNEEMTQEELIQAMAANEDELDVVAAKKAALEVERIQSDENEDFNGAILSDDPILNEELEELTMGLTKAERYAVLKMEQECKAEFEERLKETIAYEKQHQTSDDTMEGQNDGTDLFEEVGKIKRPKNPPAIPSRISERISKVVQVKSTPIDRESKGIRNRTSNKIKRSASKKTTQSVASVKAIHKAVEKIMSSVDKSGDKSSTPVVKKNKKTVKAKAVDSNKPPVRSPPKPQFTVTSPLSSKAADPIFGKAIPTRPPHLDTKITVRPIIKSPRQPHSIIRSTFNSPQQTGPSPPSSSQSFPPRPSFDPNTISFRKSGPNTVQLSRTPNVRVAVRPVMLPPSRSVIMSTSELRPFKRHPIDITRRQVDPNLRTVTPRAPAVVIMPQLLNFDDLRPTTPSPKK